MEAIVYKVDTDEMAGRFTKVESQVPKVEGHDLLVKIQAISVNPVDYKVRQRILTPEDGSKILGWDAAGIVESAGDRVSLFGSM